MPGKGKGKALGRAAAPGQARAKKANYGRSVSAAAKAKKGPWGGTKPAKPSK